MDINSLQTSQGGPGNAPRENLKISFSEIAGNVHFSNYFYIFEVFKGGDQVTRKGHFDRVLLKVGGRVLPLPPWFLCP